MSWARCVASQWPFSRCQHLTPLAQVGFGRGFDMVKSATTAKPIVLLEQGVKLIMASGNVAWLMAMFKYLPNPIVLFEAWIRETLEQRVREGKTGVVEHDVFSWLLGEAKNQGATQTMPELNADAGGFLCRECAYMARMLTSSDRPADRRRQRHEQQHDGHYDLCVVVCVPMCQLIQSR